MKAFDLWKFSFLNLMSSPLRTSLTILGMAIGISAILAVSSLGDAGQFQVEQELGRLGINRVWITAKNGEKLERGHSSLLTEKLGLPASELIYDQSSVVSKQCAVILPLAGCSVEMLQSLSGKVCSGRLPAAQEWHNVQSGVVVGTEAAEKLYVQPGDLLEIRHHTFRVVCILGSGDGFSNIDVDATVFLPLQVMENWSQGAIHEIQIALETEMNSELIGQEAQYLLDLYYGMDTDMTTMQVQADAANSILNTFIQVLAWIAVICIAVGGVGVMNILLVSIRERQSEIGIMKAMGTTNGQICALFLIEALGYAICGGVAGVVLGTFITAAAGRSIGVEADVQIRDCIKVWLMAAGAGIMFGVMPALRAAGLKPSEALRTD